MGNLKQVIVTEVRMPWRPLMEKIWGFAFQLILH